MDSLVLEQHFKKYKWTIFLTMMMMTQWSGASWKSLIIPALLFWILSAKEMRYVPNGGIQALGRSKWSSENDNSSCISQSVWFWQITINLARILWVVPLIGKQCPMKCANSKRKLRFIGRCALGKGRVSCRRMELDCTVCKKNKKNTT